MIYFREEIMKKNYLKYLISLLLVFNAMSCVSVYASEITENLVQPESGTNFQELSRENFHPAFTKNTVLKLNAIVSKSLDVINEYDSVMGQVRRVKKTPIEEQNLSNEIERINQLSSQSKQILSEMLLAEKALKDSDEVFNRAILAGMVDFVSDVEREVTAQSQLLSQSLSKR